MMYYRFWPFNYPIDYLLRCFLCADSSYWPIAYGILKMPMLPKKTRPRSLASHLMMVSGVVVFIVHFQNAQQAWFHSYCDSLDFTRKSSRNSRLNCVWLFFQIDESHRNFEKQSDDHLGFVDWGNFSLGSTYLHFRVLSASGSRGYFHRNKSRNACQQTRITMST